MVEHQSCAGLVNTSALCAIEQEVKGESNVNVISLAEISAELQRERQKNAELMERISALEAQIKERDKEAFLTNGQGSCPSGVERSVKKFKRQKTGTFPNGAQRGHEAHGEMASQIKNDSSFIFPKCTNAEDHPVNWMSLEAELSHVNKLRDDDFVAEFDDTDDSDDEEEFEDAPTNTNTENKNGPSCLETHLYEDGYNATRSTPSLGSFFNGRIEATWLYKNQETTCNKEDHLKKNGGKDAYRELADHKTAADGPVSWKEADHAGIGSISYVRKPPKMAFCPKEVKRILESEALLQKNAQSHTIRKIIIFASLGIRHGIDDMYELDFNHFSILRKGEPYVSPTDPGEHVLYKNPGVRSRIFYPNHQNPTLCPVQILEEEKAMRPCDPSCPSCLFLCIKYGGRTRNLPQNEYVRQRMGRNKLKSFGPVICRMAMLVYIRSGSFFFKALGITLLFMAGFPDDLVQRETKYRNLDLLQKYYRTDGDAEGEELFLPHPITCESEATPGSEKLSWKTSTSKPKAKRQLNSASQPPALQKSAIQQTAPSSSTVSPQFGLQGYTSSQSHGMAAIQSMPSQTPEDTLQGRNQMISRPGTAVSYQNQAQYHMFPPQSANTFIPMIYWSAPNPFPPTPFASTYGYQSFPSTTSYITIPPQPQAYYGNPSCSSVIPRAVERNGKIGMTLEEADSDSETSSSNTEAKAAPGDCKK